MFLISFVWIKPINERPFFVWNHLRHTSCLSYPFLSGHENEAGLRLFFFFRFVALSYDRNLRVFSVSMCGNWLSAGRYKANSFWSQCMCPSCLVRVAGRKALGWMTFSWFSGDSPSQRCDWRGTISERSSYNIEQQPSPVVHLYSLLPTFCIFSFLFRNKTCSGQSLCQRWQIAVRCRFFPYRT